MGIELNTGQIYCVYDLEHWWQRKDKQVFEISGGAGTGKTTVINYFINRIGLKKSNVLFLAYMGKAASVLQRNGLPGKTIHSAIYEYVEDFARDEYGKIIIRDNGKPKLVGKFELKEKIGKKIKLIVVDEGSMVEGKIGEDLLSFGIPVVVLGDLNQLPPVFGEPFFLKNPDVILTKVMRQAEGNPIIYLAQQVLNGQELKYGVYGNSAVISKKDLTEFQIKKADIILTGTNKLRYNINQFYRERLKKISHLEYPHIGEKVICRKNNWGRCIGNDIYLTNGMTGYVDNIHRDSFNGKSMKMDFRPDFIKKVFKNIEFDYEHMYELPGEVKMENKYSKFRDKMEYAYAITTHSCLALDTLVFSTDGIVPLSYYYHSKNRSDKYRIHNGIRRFVKPDHFIMSGIQRVHRCRTKRGNLFPVTDEHRCYIQDEDIKEEFQIKEVHGSELKIGDKVVFRKNLCSIYEFDTPYEFKYREEIKNSFLPEKMTRELAYIIGFLSTNAVYDDNNVNITVTPTGDNFFVTYMKDTFKLEDDEDVVTVNYADDNKEKEISYIINNQYIVYLLSKMMSIMGGLNKSKSVPKCILTSSIIYMMFYMLGIVDNITENEDKKLHIPNLPLKMMNQISVITRVLNLEQYTNKDENGMFDIIFDYTDKDKLVNGILKPDQLDGSVVFDSSPIVEIIETYEETACFSIPDYHTFAQNGFYGGNSQGSQWDDVLYLHENFMRDKEDNKKLLYTAITRAAENLIVVI